jgi:hypothetical protein
MEEETRALLISDFEIGHYIRERIVPRAILYFTGKTVWNHRSPLHHTRFSLLLEVCSSLDQVAHYILGL